MKTDRIKRWFHSKTMWYNAALILTGAANELLPILDFASPETADALRFPLYLMLAVGNIILRRVTRDPVTF